MARRFTSSLAFLVAVASPGTAQETCYEGICFPEGDISFADAVLRYEPDLTDPACTFEDPNASIPENALGTPDGDYVSLCEGGILELLFADNWLLNSGTPAHDLHFFEVPTSESFLVAVRPANGATEALLGGAGRTDANGDGFYEIGRVNHLGPAVTYDVNNPQTNLVVADLDGDGDQDLAGSGLSSVFVLLNGGSGVFASFQYSVDRPRGIVVGDIDGDNAPDLVVGSGSPGFVVLYNDGTGGFPTAIREDFDGSAWRYPALADFNGDGALDVALGRPYREEVKVLLNLGNAGFSSALTYGTGADVNGLVVVDLDGNGFDDLVSISREEESISVLLNVGGSLGFNGSYPSGEMRPSPTPYALDIIAADLNGDGAQDLVYPANRSVGVFFGNGDGTLDGPTLYPQGTVTYGIAASDIDQDGDPDLLVTMRNGPLALLPNRGDGTFATPARRESPSGSEDVIAADFDGDSDPDLAIMNVFADHVEVHENTGFPFPSVDLDSWASGFSAGALEFDAVQLIDDASHVGPPEDPGADIASVGAISTRILPPARLYVDTDAVGANDGTSWADAFTDLQDALNLVLLYPETNEIWVAEGTYRPTDTLDRTIAFLLPRDVELFGGFAGTEVLLGQRNWEAHPTILSGDIGQPFYVLDNSYRVIVSNNTTQSSVILDGFVVKDGYSNNVTYGNGAGLRIYNGQNEIRNCTFILNQSIQGGAIYNSGSLTMQGGSMAYCDAGRGGGLYNAGSASLDGVHIVGNQAVDGGGVYNTGTLQVTNGLLLANEATVDGGGIWNDLNPIYLTNLTMYGNIGKYGPAIFNDFQVFLTNSILWQNSAEIGPGIRNDGGGLAVSFIKNSLIDGSNGSGPTWDTSQGFDQGANLDADPLFADLAAPLGPDLHLQFDSLAIDAGDNTAPYLPATDLDGLPRVQGVQVDMGVFEWVPCPAVMYVDQDATGAADGSSWTDAYPDLQQALAALLTCQTGVDVWVAEGTYKPTPGSDRSISFDLTNGVSLLGGFNGTESAPEDRDPVAYLTILSGDIGTPAVATDNSYHVVTALNNVSANVDGFTIRDGKATALGGTGDEGGGMLVQNASVVLRNLNFVANVARDDGGGLAVVAGSAEVSSTSFSGNQSQLGSGGGASLAGGTATFTNVVFSQNTATRGGGVGNAGALTVINALFWQNMAGWGGGFDSNGTDILTNVTFSGNQASFTGGGMLAGDLATVTNAVLWGNLAPVSPQLGPGAALNVSNSLIQGSGGSGPGWSLGGTDGGGNIDADPKFVDPIGGDLRLVDASSPAVDQGDALAPGLPTTDLDGNPRIFGNTVDVGAYELEYVATAISAESDVPAAPALQAAFPNPFNPRTTIRYALRTPARVRLRVYDAAGRLVRVLVDQDKPAGHHSVEWDGKDDRAQPVASGVYLYRLNAEGFVEAHRMTLIK